MIPKPESTGPGPSIRSEAAMARKWARRRTVAKHEPGRAESQLLIAEQSTSSGNFLTGGQAARRRLWTYRLAKAPASTGASAPIICGNVAAGCWGRVVYHPRWIASCRCRIPHLSAMRNTVDSEVRTKSTPPPGAAGEWTEQRGSRAKLPLDAVRLVGRMAGQAYTQPRVQRSSRSSASLGEGT